MAEERKAQQVEEVSHEIPEGLNEIDFNSIEFQRNLKREVYLNFLKQEVKV